MKSSRMNYVIVGAFVLAMVGALVVTVAMLAGQTGATDTYYTRLQNVSGIKFGTQVTYEGYPIGQVETVEPERLPNGRVRFKIELSVTEGWQIPEGSVAQVTASGLLAAVSINIDAPPEAVTMLEAGTHIPGREMKSMFAAFEDVAGNIDQVSQEDLRPLLKNLNHYVGSLGAVLEKTAPDLLSNLQALSTDLRTTMPQMIKDISVVTADLAKKGPAITGNLEAFSKNANAVSADLLETKQRVDAMLTQMETLMGDFDDMVVRNRDTVDESLGNLRHTLQAVSRHIDSITYNLEGTSRNMHEFSRQLRQNPGVLLSGQATADDAAKK